MNKYLHLIDNFFFNMSKLFATSKNKNNAIMNGFSSFLSLHLIFKIIIKSNTKNSEEKPL